YEIFTYWSSDVCSSDLKELRRRLDVAASIEAGTAPEVRVIESTAMQKATVEPRAVDRYDTMEYRRAFMEYVTRGVKNDILEFRELGRASCRGRGGATPW